MQCAQYAVGTRGGGAQDEALQRLTVQAPLLNYALSVKQAASALVLGRPFSPYSLVWTWSEWNR